MSTTKSECCEKSQFNPCDCTCHSVGGLVKRFSARFTESDGKHDFIPAKLHAHKVLEFVEEERNTLIDELVVSIRERFKKADPNQTDWTINEILSLLQSKKK